MQLWSFHSVSTFRDFVYFFWIYASCFYPTFPYRPGSFKACASKLMVYDFCIATAFSFSKVSILICLFQGLSDDIHTVIKHSLSAIDLLFSLILPALKNAPMKFDNSNFQNVWKLDDLNAASQDVLRIDQILDELLITGSNKNWVVQSKYCDLVTNIDFDEIRMIMGDDFGWYYEVNCYIYL